ncbi:endonuclease/exonuclease/phosphatase family protein [Vibrio aestuarianus]|uniref:endonuclease/exonuclease/phosphatase family protein n=1 Tax=Vibrio aestuarianus TaxID=28171 RepID=UPI001558996F|nr:endonuclease/exonuclease/phosphatase family protein [Vibrio aestuarianus]NGZ14144.1 endonuclease/exonuclease/phosphatase family protein [Vibrio aestuarianus]NKZ50292.1 endonuclease/exonuclease/phosphatase family protein [Vibrio aestuarianus]
MKKSKIRPVLTAGILFTISFCGWAQSLKLATWNIEWLSLTPSTNIAESQRSEQDFSALQHHFTNFPPDVLAFQEVDSREAIQRIVGMEYNVLISDRSSKGNRRYQFNDQNQYTGFAVRQGIAFADPDDLNLTPNNKHKLRFASYVVLYPNTPQQIHLLSVHLKAGCSGKFRASSTSCKTLKAQGLALNQWLLEKERLNQAYAILGDFNHNLAYPNDWLWQVITDGAVQPPQLATQDTAAVCKVRSNKNPQRTHQFRSLIDHVIVSHSLKASQTQQITYPSAQILKYRLSDHCPITSVINY